MKIHFTFRTIAAAMLLGGMIATTPALAQHRQPRGGSQSQSHSSAPRERVERPSSSMRHDAAPSVSSGRERSTVNRGQSNGGSYNRPSSSSSGRNPGRDSGGSHHGGGNYSGGGHHGSGNYSGGSSSSSRPSTLRNRSVAPDIRTERPSFNNGAVSRGESRSINDRNRGGSGIDNRGGNDRDNNRGGTGNYGNRPGRGGNNDGNYGNRPGRGGNDRDRDNRGGNYGNRPGRGGNSNHDGHGNHFNRPDNRGGNHGGKDRPGGFNARPDNRPHHERPGGGDPNRFSRYHQYRYHDGFRPHGPHHDRFYDHYRYGWNRPIMPPVRPYRHTIWYYRPTIPYGFRPYRNAPIVDGILGLFFGTLYDASLDYLYYNGFAIDGYYDNIVYLRDVPLFDYEWPDVMLRYDDYNQL
ncbi:MAG: hypothetical protein II603_01375, partial [Muribaculaceae bacterium]|nr:hypothetical protein [Muribaculaceae bacterium]